MCADPTVCCPNFIGMKPGYCAGFDSDRYCDSDDSLVILYSSSFHFCRYQIPSHLVTVYMYSLQCIAICIDKVSCESMFNCDVIRGNYACRVDPECILDPSTSTMECRDNKKCLVQGGLCDVDADCDEDFVCVQLPHGYHSCINYQTV